MALAAASPAYEVCKTMVKTMADFAGRNRPEVLNPLQYGVSRALTDATNASGAMEIETNMFTEPYTAGATSNNALRVKYRVRRCDDSIAATLDPCDDEGITHAAWAYRDFLFTTPVSHSFTIKQASMRRMCESYSEEYAMLLRETIDTLLRKRNARYITQLAANFGKYYHTDCSLAAVSDTDTASVALFDSNGQPQPMGAFKILQQYRRNGFQGEPYVIGGSAIEKMDFARAFFAGNSNGFDVNRLGGVRTYTDYQLDTVLNNGSINNMISIAPGAARPLYWNRFQGDGAYRSDTLVKTTLDIGRLMGLGESLLVDHSVYVKECGQADIEYIHKFYLYTDLFALEDTMLSDDCNQCSNGILLWDHDCADPSCDDLNPSIAAT